MNNENTSDDQLDDLLDSVRRDLLSNQPVPDARLLARFGDAPPLTAGSDETAVLPVFAAKPARKHQRVLMAAAAAVVVLAVGATILAVGRPSNSTAVVATASPAAAAGTADSTVGQAQGDNSGSATDEPDTRPDADADRTEPNNTESGDTESDAADDDTEGTEHDDEDGADRGEHVLPDLGALFDSFADRTDGRFGDCDFSSTDSGFSASCRWPDCDTTDGDTDAGCAQFFADCGGPAECFEQFREQAQECAAAVENESPLCRGFGHFIYGLELCDLSAESITCELPDITQFDFGDFNFDGFSFLDGLDTDADGEADLFGFGFGDVDGFRFDNFDFGGCLDDEARANDTNAEQCSPFDLFGGEFDGLFGEDGELAPNLEELEERLEGLFGEDGPFNADLEKLFDGLLRDQPEEPDA